MISSATAPRAGEWMSTQEPADGGGGGGLTALFGRTSCTNKAPACSPEVQICALLHENSRPAFKRPASVSGWVGSAKAGAPPGAVTRYRPARACVSKSPTRSKSVLPAEPMMDTQPPQAAIPRTAVPKTFTASSEIVCSCTKRPTIGEDTSGCSRQFTHWETHLYCPGGYPAASGAARASCSSSSPSYFVRSMYCRLPGDGRTSSGTKPPSGIRVSCMTATHLSPIMSAAYSLLKKVGFSTQAPAYPLCSL
mmetsp:Transcript_48763/g.91306  ORF Transcript_48763/g.91306 Transcript_48763/m.91306 type:complete len:251 (+) Transcript_48763:477-1229(+)